jgi:hypothetical protein
MPRSLLILLMASATVTGSLRAQEIEEGAASSWPPKDTVLRVSAIDWDPARPRLDAYPRRLDEPPEGASSPIPADLLVEAPPVVQPPAPAPVQRPVAPPDWSTPSIAVTPMPSTMSVGSVVEPQPAVAPPSPRPQESARQSLATAPPQPQPHAMLPPPAPRFEPTPAADHPRPQLGWVPPGTSEPAPQQMASQPPQTMAPDRQTIQSTYEPPPAPRIEQPSNLALRGEPVAQMPSAPQPQFSQASHPMHQARMQKEKPEADDDKIPVYDHPVHGMPIDQIPQYMYDEDRWYLGPVDPTCRTQPHLEPEKLRLWYTRLEGLYWGRQALASQVLAVSNTSGTAILNTRDLSFDFSPGVRVGIGRSVPESGDFELTYSGIMPDESFLTVAPGAGTVDSLFTQSDPLFVLSPFSQFNGADQYNLAYEWQLHDFQANFSKYAGVIGGMHAHMNAGLRYILLEENMQLTASGGNVVGQSVYRIETLSHLFGPQAGGGVHYPLGDGNWISVHGNAGFMVSAGEQELNVSTVLGSLHSQEQDMTVAPMMELGITGRAELGPRAEIFAGYSMLLLSGLTLASEQVDYSADPTISPRVDNRSTAFFHGFNGGMSVRW